MKKYENMDYLDIWCLPHEEFKKIPEEYKKKALDEFHERWEKEHPHVNLRIRGDIPID